jgi:hypothetical protein
MNTLSLSLRMLALLLSLGATRAGGQALPDFASRIDARAIAVISDGDFRASTYRDNRLAVQRPDYRDVLTLLRPGAGGGVAEVAVSNSVTAPPEVMAVAPDGLRLRGRASRAAHADVATDARPRTRPAPVRDRHR